MLSFLFLSPILIAFFDIYHHPIVHNGFFLFPFLAFGSHQPEQCTDKLIERGEISRERYAVATLMRGPGTVDIKSWGK